MPIRHHNNIGEILPPFAENLVFWAPLTEGDLTDHISRSVGYPINADTGNLVWNDENKSYRLHTSINYTNALTFDTPNFATLFGTSNSFTWSILIKKLSTTTYQFIIGYSKSGDSAFNYGYSLHHLASYQSYISSSQFDRFTLVYNGDTNLITIYKNGVQFATQTPVATWPGAPLNWKQHYTEHISIASSIGGNFTTDAYMKDARIYNRAFTASEVAQL